MNERKKNLPKRLLSMTLALSMCAGLSCTTAFAAEGDQGDPNSDYVYVYINVKPSTVETGTAEATPKFDGKTGEITKAESAVTEAKGSFTEGETAPKFDSSKQDALDKAQTDVKDKLDALENTAKPEYKDATATEGEGNIQDDTNSDSQGDAQNIGENSGESTTEETGGTDVSGEPTENEPSFSEEVNERVDALNTAQGTTNEQVTDAGKQADASLKAVQDAKAELDKKLDEARTELNSKKEEANTAVKDAQDAVKACEDKKAELDADLEKQIADLGQRPSETAPVRESFQSYDEYSAQYDAWKTQCETYNKAVEAIQTAYDADVALLNAENKKATAAVDAAQAALNAAQKQLEAFNTQSQEGFNNLNKDSFENFAALKAYNDALKAYNDAVKSYNDAAGEYNTAAGNYETAVDEFNDAAQKHNQVAETYNGKVTTYTDAVTAYEKAVDDYNAKVDTFNKDSAAWNKQQTDAAKNKVNIETLKNVNQKDIEVYQEVSSALNSSMDSGNTTNPIASLSKEKVEAYNRVVDTYNAAVKTWNDNAVTNMLSSVQSYFGTQEPHGQKESKNLWYTVGKINIKGIFSGTPDELRNKYFNTSHSDYESPAGDDYNGRDLYYFDKAGNATLVELQQNANESNLYAQGKQKEDLLNALGGKDKQFSQFKDRGDSTFDPAKDINKWVLKAGYNGADNYNEVASNRSAWHLDGYLYVEQLATLARLELQAEKKEYAEKDKAVTVKPVAPVTEAELYDTHWGVLEPNYTPDTESWENAPTVPDFTDRNLSTVVPGGITITDPTPEPPTPPSGGGDNPGGGSNPGGGGNDNPPVDIPEEDPPLVDVPEEDPPLVDIPEEEPPLVDAPEEDPVLDIPEEEPPLVAPPTTVVITETKTPLVKAPAGVDIVDEAVPLADVPKTGDNTALWIAMALASVSALAVLAPRKKENG